MSSTATLGALLVIAIIALLVALAFSYPVTRTASGRVSQKLYRGGLLRLVIVTEDNNRTILVHPDVYWQAELGNTCRFVSNETLLGGVFYAREVGCE